MAQGSWRSFPRSFWVANVMELFERAAYYGMNSVLAVYLTRHLKFDEQSVGFLQGIVYAATYVIPILGGALADRYGYRRMLMVAFSLLASGYALAGLSSVYALVFLSLLVMACGAGLFKPIISGTIARTTDATTSALGFGIYYWMINLGALIAPLVVSELKDRNWTYVFVASAIYTGAMLLPAVFVYRDPPRPENTKTLKDALMGAVEVLGDARFMLMVVVYSGFWILYFQNFNTVLWYINDFVDTTPVNALVNGFGARLGFAWDFKFDSEHVTVINAGTIILLQVFVSWIVEKRAALPVMISGMAIGALGFGFLASSQNIWVIIAGVAVFSIGEMTAHPKYYSFIGIVAPADRKAVYMGYAFLYGVFGALLGSNLGSLAYSKVLKPLAVVAEAGAKPSVGSTAMWFWGAFALLDVCAAAGLWLFARKFGTDTEETRRKAKGVMTVVYSLLGALGVGFLVWAVTSTPFAPKTAVQAVLFIALGGLGLWISLRKAPAKP